VEWTHHHQPHQQSNLGQRDSACLSDPPAVGRRTKFSCFVELNLIQPVWAGQPRFVAWEDRKIPSLVILAKERHTGKTGIQAIGLNLDSGFRRNDDKS